MFEVTVDTEPHSKFFRLGLRLALLACVSQNCLTGQQVTSSMTGEMNVIKCQECGAECAPATSFCRQCGSPIEPEATTGPSEQATALLDQSVNAATQRFEPRATGPDPVRLQQTVVEPTETWATSRRGMLIGALAILVIGVICVATLIGLRARGDSTANLVYPGAKTVVDMTGQGGGRALHLETSDSFSTVEEWYQKELKPHKTMRLTSSSVVLKNDKTTATIASEGAKTSILIKVAP